MISAEFADAVKAYWRQYDEFSASDAAHSALRGSTLTTDAQRTALDEAACNREAAKSSKTAAASRLSQLFDAMPQPASDATSDVNKYMLAYWFVQHVNGEGIVTEGQLLQMRSDLHRPQSELDAAMRRVTEEQLT